LRRQRLPLLLLPPYTTLFRSPSKNATIQSGVPLLISFTSSKEAGLLLNNGSIYSDAYRIATAARCSPISVSQIFHDVLTVNSLRDRKSTRLNSSHVSTSYAVL